MVGLTTTVRSAYVTGFSPNGTYQVQDGQSMIIFDPASTIGTFSPYNINLPLHPLEDQTVHFTTTATISGVTFSAIYPVVVHNSFNTIYTSNSSTSASGFIFKIGNNAWFAIP